MAVGLGGEQLWLSPTVANNVNPFDDQSGQGNNGTAFGTTVVANSGSGGAYAYNFDGINDYIDCGLASATASLSISLWVNVLSFSNSNKGIAGTLNSGGTSDEYGILAWPGSVNRPAGLVYGNTVFSPSALSQSTWHQLAIVKDSASSKLRIYRDGVLETEVNSTSSPPASATKDFIIGRYGGGNYFGGLMDDVRKYDRALTQSEITHLATSRGVLGPPGGATHYNPFKSHAFINDFQQRLR